MDRLIATGSVNLAGADTAPVSGTPQYATNGTPGVTNPTQFPAYQYNAIQEEIVSVILDAGITPDRTKNNQLLAALGRSGGSCRLTLSGGNLLLKPYNGNKVFIPATGLMTVPAAGVSLAVGAALTEGGTPVANTLYYIYAFNNSGTLAIQASATGHATDSNTGVEIRSGDATRALVGMAQCVTGPVWSTVSTQVLSWFNRRTVATAVPFTATAATSSASPTFAELSASFRNTFLTWADEAVNIDFVGTVSMSAGTSGANSSIGIDNATAQDTFGGAFDAAAAAGNPPAFGKLRLSLSEGLHFATALGSVTGGTTGTWSGNATPGNRCVLSVEVRG